jgi:predicted nucleic acid-binding protein
MSEPIFVDVNIVMYAVGAEHSNRRPCQASLNRIVNEKLPAMVNSEIHQEILHRYLSLGLPDKARQVSIKLETLIPTTLPVAMSDIRRARRLSEHYPTLKARDLIHVAVMLEHGLSRILSTDVHFDQVSEVERIDPQGFAYGKQVNG